jgi:hypothetical protein
MDQRRKLVLATMRHALFAQELLAATVRSPKHDEGELDLPHLRQDKELAEVVRN